MTDVAMTRDAHTFAKDIRESFDLVRRRTLLCLRATRRSTRTVAAPTVRYMTMAIVLATFGLIALDHLQTVWDDAVPAAYTAFFEAATGWGKSDWIFLTGALILVLTFALRGTTAGRWVGRAVPLATLALLSVAASGVLVNVIKPIVGRIRPERIPGVDHMAAEPFQFAAVYASFPSGHAATVGSMVAVLCLFLPRHRGLIIYIGLLLAFSRVATGAHFISDVAIGFALGVACTYAVVAGLRHRTTLAWLRAPVTGLAAAPPGSAAAERSAAGQL